MQPLLRVLAAVLAASCCAAALGSQAASAAELAAQRWLAARSHAPGLDELADLKGQNPEAYAIVQALLTKQSMGLLKRNPHHEDSESTDADALAPAPAPVAEELPKGLSLPSSVAFLPPDPKMLAPPSAAVVAQGFPTELVGRGPLPPAKLPELPPATVTYPPPMPPPPPISSPLPPSLEDPSPSVDSEAPSPSASNEDASESAPAQMMVLPARLSAAATSSSVSSESGGGHNWLNWKPDQMIADNEKMVQSVLGAVAQLTGKRAHRAEEVNGDSMDTHPAQEAPLNADPPPAPRPVAVQRTLPESMPRAMLPRAEELPAARATVQRAGKKSESPADEYLASFKEPVVIERKPQGAADTYLATSGHLPAESAQDSAEEDGIAGHLPGAVSWSNPYTFAASAHAGTAPQQENSYLRDNDLGATELGVPQVKLPLRKTPDDDNPYLQGLDLTGSSAQAAPASISASALTAMHQSQLLNSHRLLSSFEWDGDRPQVQPRKLQAPAAVKAPRDVLSGFLRPAKRTQAKSQPASMVRKNTYLAKLGDSTATSYSSSSALASNIEQGNPYLQALDEPVVQQPVVQQPEDSVIVAPETKKPIKDARDRLAAFKWDDNRPQSVRSTGRENAQLSMASSKVQQKVQQKVGSRTVHKKDSHALEKMLGGASLARAPNAKAQRLQQVIAQRVADAKNPYLKGLDIDGDVPKVQARQEQGNPYMASFD